MLKTCWGIFHKTVRKIAWDELLLPLLAFLHISGKLSRLRFL
jgi:hypothetical protein